MSIPNLKYRTTICNNWKEARSCNKAENCFFAHGEYQLRTIQQNQRLIAAKNDQIKENFLLQNVLSNYKTIYCKFYRKGQCKLGSSCTFVHQRNQKRDKPQCEPNKQFMNWHQYSQYCWLLQHKDPNIQYYYSSFPSGQYQGIQIQQKQKSQQHQEYHNYQKEQQL